MIWERTGALIGLIGASLVGFASSPAAAADPQPYPVISAAMTSTQSLPDMYGPTVTITYTIAVTNSGLVDATGVSVTASVPDGTHYSAASGGTLTGTTVTWANLSVPAGGSISESLWVTAPSDLDGTVVSNHATFTNVNTPPAQCIQSADTTSNTCDTDTTSLTVAFWLVKVTQYELFPGDAQPVFPGETITYKFTMINTGHLAGSGLVTDNIPAGTTYVPGSATPTPVTYIPASLNQPAQVIWNPWVPAASGTTPGEVDLSFQVAVDPSAAGSTFANMALLGVAGTTALTQGYLDCQAGTTRACLTNSVSNPAQPPPPPAPVEVAFQGTSGTLRSVGSAGLADWNVGMAPNTSPSVIRLASGGDQIAFQAHGGDLWTVGASWTDWHVGMAPATSPSMVRLSDGGYEVAFQSYEGQLWTIGTAGWKNWQVGMASGTSPSLVALPGGGFEVAFQSYGGQLWTVGTAGWRDWGVGMAPGTSPSAFAPATGGYEVAFQSYGATLWTVGSLGWTDWGVGMASGTSPSAVRLSSRGYEIAFQAYGGALWSVGTDGWINWRVGMAPGTDPSLTAFSKGGFQVAFQSYSGDLWTVGNAGWIDWPLGVAPSTSPSTS